MNCLLLLFSAYFAVTPQSPVVASSDDTKVVYVQDRELFVASGMGGQARQITHDGIAKALPVWSKDGSSIAFVEVPRGRGELGRLLIVDESGHTLRSLSVRSQAPAGGMRFIETLEWLDQERVALSGSANPSLMETTIVNLATGEQEFGIFDDGRGVDFSPDGQHLALTAGAPHFTPADEQEPALEIDYKRVYPPAGMHVELLSKRIWSPDSRKVAVIARDFATKGQKIVIAEINGIVSTRSIDLKAGSRCEPVWVSGEAVVACRKGERLTLSAAERPNAQSVLSILQGALNERSRLVTAVTSVGGSDADVWCKTCPLSMLVRKAPGRD